MHKRTQLNKGCPEPRSPSLRDELEKQAWIRYPGLARRLASIKRRARNTHHHKSRIMRWQDRTLLTLGAILLTMLLIRVESAVANDQQWGLRLQLDAGEYTQLAIDTAVQVEVTGLIARVEVTQQFANHSSQWAEAIYRFPLPQGAAVDRLRIRVGERVLEGEIQEKQSARRIYQKALDTGRTASLVEQQRRNQFETRLSNIGPGEAVEVSIAYLQNISYSDFSYHLRIPMTFTPRWTPGRPPSTLQVPWLHTDNNQPEPLLMPSSSTSDHALSLQLSLVSTIEFAAIESRYHDVDIRQVDGGYQLKLINPNEMTDRDFELSWTPALQTQPSASLTTFNDGDAVYAQLMLAPPLADSINPQPREVILIIDTSGSMEGASLEQAKAALFHALGSLGAQDQFNLLQFNSSTELLYEQSVGVTPASIYVAQNFINSLHANGGTDMAPALKAALAMPQIPGLIRQVVFITDGAVGNESGLLQRVAAELGDSRMFTVAIGHAPNSWFMRKTAEIGRGSYVHIGKLAEVEQQMSALWDRIQVPALTDICIDWGGSAEYYPEIIPDLYSGEPLWLVARLEFEPHMIDLCGNYNDQEWNLSINGWDTGHSIPGEETLAILWARKKIEALEDALMFGADRELTQLETTALALDYGLLTRHTSLVAVDKTPGRDAGERLAQADLPGLLPAGSSRGLATYPATATGWVSQLLLSLLVLLLATSLLWFSGSRLPMASPPAKT